MFRILIVGFLIISVTKIGVAQIRPSAKIGYEFIGMEIDELYFYDDNFGRYSVVSGLGLGKFKTLQFGGRIGGRQQQEVGLGMAFGEMSFLDWGHLHGRPKVNRKSLYMIHWFNTSSVVSLGCGSQFYWYKLNFKRVEHVNSGWLYTENVKTTWKSIGAEWRVLLKLSFGENESHEIMSYLGLSLERIRLMNTSSEEFDFIVTDYTDGLEGAWRLGINYSYTFGGNDDND